MYGPKYTWSGQNEASLCRFYRYPFGSTPMFLWEIHSLFYEVARFFLSSFSDVVRMSVSTISVLGQLDCGIICLQNAFL